MNIGNITSDNFNLDGNGKDIQIEVYEQLIEQLQQEISDLEDNWEIIRQYCLDEQIPEETDEYNSYIEFSNSVYDNILNKMQEIEQGSGGNE